MKRASLVVGCALAACALALASLRGARADDAACGSKGQPSCPLQGFMEEEMDPAVDRGDMKALAAAYEKLVKLVPDPKWNEGEAGWAKLAELGAERAKQGDGVGAKKQCKACHKAWRDKYKDSFRTRPLPK